jgi:hypothetical protein
VETKDASHYGLLDGIGYRFKTDAARYEAAVLRAESPLEPQGGDGPSADAVRG